MSILVSGRLSPEGHGWCYYCGFDTPDVTTKRCPRCGDCWFPAPPECTCWDDGGVLDQRDCPIHDRDDSA